jgi:Fe-S-cluster containining protein
MYQCEKCGACCKNLDKSSFYSWLHSGDGICKYLNGNMCSIYESRPFLCRIDQCYDAFYKNIMSKKDYYEINHESCIKLREIIRNKK